MPCSVAPENAFQYLDMLHVVTLKFGLLCVSSNLAPISAVEHLLWQVRLPGTRCQTISVIRRLAKTLLCGH